MTANAVRFRSQSSLLFACSCPSQVAVLATKRDLPNVMQVETIEDAFKPWTRSFPIKVFPLSVTQDPLDSLMAVLIWIEDCILNYSAATPQPKALAPAPAKEEDVRSSYAH